MGGIGSGQWERSDRKTAVEECIGLNIARLTREGWLRWNAPTCFITLSAGKRTSMNAWLSGNELTIMYCILSGRDQGQFVQQHIPIVRTFPHFGGHRLWWQCPTCSRRVGKLHMLYAIQGYVCRHCANVTYQSTREPTLQKLLARENARFKRIALLMKKRM